MDEILDGLRKKRIGIVGYGKEGSSLASFFSGRGIGFSIYDGNRDVLKDVPPNLRGVFHSGDGYLDEAAASSDVIFRSPSMPFNHPVFARAKKNGVEITSATKFFFDLCKGTTIGITGTKGKGTTSRLLYRMLESSGKNVFLGGNFGNLLFDSLDKIDKDSFVIMELSSFQLEDLAKSPHIAVVLGITSEHLDRHGGFQEYADAKLNLVKFQNPSDFAVFCADNEIAKSFALKTPAKKYWFSTASVTEPGGFYSDGELILKTGDQEETICRTGDLKILGKHNWHNVLAASVAASILGVDAARISGAAKDFAPLPHRLEKIASINGVLYIDDSSATTPEAAIAAIDAFPKNGKILILGGSEKNSNYKLLVDKIRSADVRGAVLVGKTSEKLFDLLKQAGFSGFLEKGASSMRAAVARASSLAEPGDAVLLSPACASFGMFKNYADRGRQFGEAVKNLKNINETEQK